MRSVLLWILRLTEPRQSPRYWRVLTRAGRAYRLAISRDPDHDRTVRHRAGRA